VLIGAVDVLEPLFGRVIVPESVNHELSDALAPQAVQSWIARPPSWVELRPDPPADPSLAFLDQGEGAAIALAELISADELLIDDLAGRIEAERRHIRVTGTVGVLADAHVAGLLDFDTAAARLRSTSFRVHPDVERAVRQRIAAEGKT